MSFCAEQDVSSFKILKRDNEGIRHADHFSSGTVPLPVHDLGLELGYAYGVILQGIFAI